MGPVNVALLVVAAVVMAAVVALLCRPRRAGRDVMPAVIAGAVVLALGLANVYQLTAATRMPMAAPTLAANPRPAGATTPAATQPRSGAAHPFLQDPKDQEVVDQFHRLFYEMDGTWQNRQWLGVRCLQNPNDVWVTQEIMMETKPDYVIEAGTAAGGGAVLWSMLLREINPDAKVITMDIEDPRPEAINHPLWKERVEFIKGSSTDPATVAKLAERVRGKRVLVILDSDHRKPHVLNELKAYSPMVGVGSYLIVQDTNVNGHPVGRDFGPGPMEALDEFLATNDGFEIDRTRESLLFTLHPRGYLKRVK